MADALSKAIQKEEARQKQAALTRVEDRAQEAELIAKATSAAGVVAGAIHDKLRGEETENGEQGVAKFGPVPANLALGLGAVGVSLLIPQKRGNNTVRNVVGGSGMGLAFAGLYRLTYDNWPEGEEE